VSQPAQRLTELQQAFADSLLSTHAVKFGEFRLKLHEKQPDAPLSPIYIDLRILQSYPDALDAAVAALAELIQLRGLTYSCYAGIPLAATPLVTLLSHQTRVPMITPRESKTHGRSETVNGVFTPGDTALVIDDVVSRAESKLEAIGVLEESGLVVRDVVVLVDREQGGSAELAAAGYQLHAVVQLGQLLEFWHRANALDQSTYQRILDYFS
jgi:uridine monophosphate synthetase